MGIKKEVKHGKANLYPQVEDLYVKFGKTPMEISNLLGVPKQTIYRWLREENAKRKRKEMQTTSYQMGQEIRSALPDLIAKFKAEPDSKKADAIMKVVKVFKTIDKDADFVGHALKTMKEFAIYLREVDPDNAALLLDHVDGFIKKIYDENK